MKTLILLLFLAFYPTLTGAQFSRAARDSLARLSAQDHELMRPTPMSRRCGPIPCLIRCC